MIDPFCVAVETPAILLRGGSVDLHLMAINAIILTATGTDITLELVLFQKFCQ
jgi:hypothetical protein